MKQLLLIVCCSGIIASCGNHDVKVKSAQTAPAFAKNADVVVQNLKGSVKTITENSVMIDSTGKEKPDSLTRITEFNEKGYQTAYVQKNQGGTVVSEDFNTRRPDGLVSEFGTKKNGKVFSRMEIEIDGNGKYVSAKSFDSTGKQDSYYKDLAQNEYGIVYAGTHYGLNNKIKGTWKNNFDEFRFRGGKSTDSTGKTTYEGTANVNDKGDMSDEEYTYVENGKSKHEKNTFKYDSYDQQGNWTQRTTYNAMGKPTQIIKRSFTYYKQ